MRLAGVCLARGGVVFFSLLLPPFALRFAAFRVLTSYQLIELLWTLSLRFPILPPARTIYPYYPRTHVVVDLF
jgi:hypothetical protein